MAQGTKFGSEKLARVSVGWREDQLNEINRIALERGQSFGSVVRDLVDASLRPHVKACLTAAPPSGYRGGRQAQQGDRP